jgi:hypothetical protein
MAILDKWFNRKLNQNKDTIYNLMEYRFNNALVDSRWQTNPENIFTRTLMENSKWQSGIVEELEFFYKITYPKMIGYNATPVVSYFWHKVTPKTMRGSLGHSCTH